MAIIFNQSVLHGRTRILPGVPVAFDDPAAEPYFTALAWAAASAEPAVHTYPADEVAIDPQTRIAATGQFVLPDLAAAQEG